MGTVYLARLTRADDETLRGFLKFYPAGSYDVWLDLQTKEIESLRANGAEAVLVDISADEVIAYCRSSKARNDIHVLKAVAALKANGKLP